LNGSLNDFIGFIQLTKLLEGQSNVDNIAKNIIYREAKQLLQSTYRIYMGTKIPIDIRLTPKALDYIRAQQK
jgi:hypothetical protein